MLTRYLHSICMLLTNCVSISCSNGRDIFVNLKQTDSTRTDVFERINVFLVDFQTENGSADEVLGLPDRGAHFVHPADEVPVPADVLGRRPAPVPREH